MRSDSRILIFGHNDSIENALRTSLVARGFKQVKSNTQDQVDVLSQMAVNKLFKSFKPDYVFLGSVRSGGILVNQQYPAEFIYENCLAQSLIIHAAHCQGIKKLLYYGGSCAYPTAAKQPIREEALLTGPLELSSEPYAVSKIAGIKMCQAYRAQYGLKTMVAIPATLYGPGSDTNLATAHVLGALMAKFYYAVYHHQTQVVVWGSGKARREFLYVDDFVDASVLLMNRSIEDHIVNVGSGLDVSIKQLAYLLKDISGFKGKIQFDTTKPDGAMRKLLDNNRILKLGWKPKIKLDEGIARTYLWYKTKAAI